MRSSWSSEVPLYLCDGQSILRIWLKRKMGCGWRYVHAIAVETVLARDGLPAVEVSFDVSISILCFVAAMINMVKTGYAPESSTNLVTLRDVSAVPYSGRTDAVVVDWELTYALAGLEVNLHARKRPC